MGAISQNVIDAAYRLARDVRLGQKAEELAVEELVDLGMRRASARMYIDNYNKMIRGGEVTRTMSKATFQTYLSNIMIDDGPLVLRRALDATVAHTRYYEKHGREALSGVEAIAVDFPRRLSRI